MKHLLLLALFFPMLVFGQATSPSLISSSGDSYMNANLNMDFSLGEIVVETFFPSQTPLPLVYNILTQGFHQPVLKTHTGLSEINVATKVYPNPTSSFVTVELDNDDTGDILIYDIHGKLITTYKFYKERKKQLDFSLLSQGNYFIHININDKKDIYKIQKIN